MKGIIGRGNWVLLTIYMFALWRWPKGMNLKCVIVGLREVVQESPGHICCIASFLASLQI